MEWAQASGTLRSSPGLKMPPLGSSGSPHPWPLWAQGVARRAPEQPQARWCLGTVLNHFEGPGDGPAREKRTGEDLESPMGAVTRNARPQTLGSSAVAVVPCPLSTWASWPICMGLYMGTQGSGKG